ncbi:MAG TPA: Sir2 family NAD-dependent protein deacetylase [Thermoanaerobaculia bacterium]|nr:Sir2 family NAD-dependent protein deacetylase [Thermoanaerobaculia bacterium]
MSGTRMAAMLANHSSLDELYEAVEHAHELLVVTGAGISLASGIPTFRGTDAGALWKRDVTELATLSFFLENPAESWRWYLSRFETLREAEPNAGHLALVELEQWQTARDREFLLVTQNIDTLHARAGSERLIEVHGSAARVRCPSPGCRLGAPSGSLPRPDAGLESFRADPSPENLPRCPECEAPLRPHVLWFDEFYGDHEDYNWEQVLAAGERADVALFVGTSFSVGVTDLLVRATALRGAPAFSLDPGAERPPHPSVRVVPAAAEEALPELVRLLR